ncbi:MAG: hypothetical protein A2167_03220 [Planctomycetes bacterium RBG_13_46_10]|nr:MAG: hypothetical protein A2167_03220 [Planctomycetes bacterium RBG_13_46_10]
MDRQQIALKLTIDGLELPFKIDTFYDRLILQKAVYLSQAIGINLGYYYQWYLHGPYCPSLTRDEYAVAVELGQDIDESKGWTLDDVSKDRLKNLKNLIPKVEQKKISRKLELLSSIHFLVSRKQIRCSEANEISNTLKKFEKDFTEEEVREAVRELQEYGLLAR